MKPYFMTPYGFITWAKHTKNFGVFHHYDKEKMMKAKEAQARVNQFFSFTENDLRRRNDDAGKQNFFDCWREVVPEPFCYDRVLAKRINNLAKITQMTYSVDVYSKPFKDNN